MSDKLRKDQLRAIEGRGLTDEPIDYTLTIKGWCADTGKGK